MKKKIFVSFLTATLIVLGLFPTVSLAADLSFDLKDYADGSVINIGAGDTAVIQDTSFPELTHYNVQIVCGEGAKVTFFRVRIDNSAYDGVCPISFTGAGNTLTLTGGGVNSLTAGAGQPAIRVEGGTDLTIGGGLGTLNAQGGTSAAGLGGGSGQDCGMISISMGTVTAEGGSGGAGIGGGEGGAGGTINISVSTVLSYTTVTTVTAGSSYAGAGIGGGKGRDGGTINISGGTVSAGSYGGAGIGGGEDGSGGTINISGGTVTANSGGGAGIGGGISGSGGTINISGGMVTAGGVSGGSGIGGGENGSGGTVSITGGIVTADNSGSAHDIGGGYSGAGGTLSADGACAVILKGTGTNAAVTLGTCGFKGAGSLAGVYIDGTRYTSGSVIDVSGSSGAGYTFSSPVFTINTSGEYLIWNATAENRVVVAPGVDADIILFGTRIESPGCAFNMTGATVDITLTGSSILKSSPGYNGILCPLGATLNITGSGSLNAAASNNTAGAAGSGIGGNSTTACGSITISGGTVTASGGNTRGGRAGFAGIGGAVVNISGGTVNVFSYKGGCAMGYNSNAGSSITITGGTVTATPGLNNYGIGGKGLDPADITISGGAVTAIGDVGAPGMGGTGGTLNISGGTVVAYSKNQGAGIAMYSGETNISGGIVYAASGDPAEAKDIGTAPGYEGTLTITGGAMVFLKNNSCDTPVTAHINETFPAGTDEVYGTAISVPDTWTGSFGAYLRPVRLSYNANGGSGEAEVTRLYGAKVSAAQGSGFARDYYTFSGWNMAADGSGTGYAAGDEFTFLENTTLYAQWLAHPELTSSDDDAKIYTGGRIILTPNIGGGTWDWDSSFFNAAFDSAATFTALKAGTSDITYTVEGQTVSYSVTVEESELPNTGQGFAWVWVLGISSVLACTAAIALKKCPLKHN